MSEGDFNPIVPISRRKDVGAPWRSLDGAQLLNANDTRFLESVPIDLFAYLARDGANDGVDSELAKWVAMLGPLRSAWRLTIPTGLIENAIGLVTGLRVTRYGIWFGVEEDPAQDGPPFIVFNYEENFADEATQLVVWGTTDADS